ncbi:MAG: flagellar protein FliS [candidate division Zixibacteria bacterium]|jgi:flagellar protein FliS|nr:flagellar protein FliS [candidate division Zixibacteria bacterium]
MNEKLQNYQAADILGKSGPELVVKVYDGAIGSMNNAVENYKAQDYESGYEAMEKAKKFIVHLYTTLDKDRGGDIAENLAKLYAFIVEQINFVQATKDLTKITDSVQILQNIREGWVQLAQDVKGKNDPVGESGREAANVKNISMSI